MFAYKPIVADEVGISVLQVIENPEHLHIVAAFRIECPGVLPYSDVVSYPVAVQPVDSSLVDKLTIGEKAVDGLPSEKVDVALHKADALLHVGRSFLGQH